MSRAGRKLASRYGRRGITLALCINAAGCFADNKATPADWRRDCVGRMELALPGDAETQSDSIGSLGARGLWIAERSESNTGFSFDDDVRGWTELTMGVVWAVSPPLTKKQIEVLRAADAKYLENNVKEQKRLAAARKEPYEWAMVDTGTPSATASRGKTGVGDHSCARREKGL